MDLFKYTAAKQQLLDCKYNKDIDKLLRDYNYKYNDLSDYNKKSSYLEYKHFYKLYTLALKLFTTKSKVKLPDFLYHDHMCAQRNIIGNLRNPSSDSIWLPLLDYSEFVDMFEFDTIVETQIYNSDYITPLHNIVLDKPLHFKFKFNQQLDYFDQYSTYSISNSRLQSHLHAIRLKQTLSPNYPATVLDQYLSDTFAAITKHQDITEHITKLQQHTSALQEYQEYYNGRA